MSRALAALAALAIATSACQSPEERLAEHRARAEAYAREGKLSESLLELRAALKVDPKNPETNLRLARLFELRGDLQQAFFFYAEAARLDPENMGTKLEVARLLLGDDPDEAARLTQEVIENEPENVGAWLRLSEVRLVQVDADGALAAALTATELAPDNPNAHHQVGRVHEARYRKARLLQEGEDEEDYRELLQEALAAFDRAAALYEEMGGGAENELERARVLGLLGRLDEAEATFRQAMELALGPRQQQKVLERALDYGRRRSPALRRWALEKRIELQPGALGAWVELAEQAEGEQPEAGSAVLDRMVESDPTSGAARVAYARFLARYERVDEAIALLAEAEADPEIDNKPAVMLDRGLLLIQSRDFPAARSVADRLRESAPEAPETALLDAQLALIERRFEYAVDVLRAAVESSGPLLPLRRMLARAYYAAGDRTRASAEVNEVLAVNSRDADMLSLQGRIQLEQGLERDAIRTLRRLGRLRRLTRSERVTLARAYYRANRPGRGRAILNRQLAGGPTPQVAIAFAENELQRMPERSRELLEAVEDRARGPQQHQVLELLTALDLSESKHQDALVRINELFEQGRGTPQALLLRAKVLLAGGEFEVAERDLLTLFGRGGDTDSEAIDLLVRLYSVQGRAEEAIASFEEASEAGVLAPETMVVLARLYWAQGELDRAETLLSDALERRADLPYAKNALAYLLAERGQQLERALSLAQEARSALPDDPNTADTLGWVYLRRGLAEPALEQFREAVGTSGQQGETAIFHHHMGLAFRELGRMEDARRAFEAALSTDPEFPKNGEAREALASLTQSG